MTRTDKQVTGDMGEDHATKFLTSQGYDIVDRNYNVIKLGKKVGEIDIVAWHKKYHHGNTLCFIEVKTRKTDSGDAERATGAKKLKNLFSAANQYCMEKAIDVERTPIQFEQVSVYTNTKTGVPLCRHYVIPVD